MRRYGSVGMVVLGVMFLVVAGGCRTPPKKDLPPLGQIPPERRTDDVQITPVGKSSDVLPPNPPMPPERQSDGARITDVAFTNVMFEFDSFKIMPSEVRKIEAVAEYLRNTPTVKLVTEGHCDERGSNEYNMSLGEHRAQAVRAHLVGLGIDAARIQTRSFGEEKPADPNHNESAWRLNRRVEFALFR